MVAENEEQKGGRYPFAASSAPFEISGVPGGKEVGKGWRRGGDNLLAITKTSF